jgi:hypothetical protein
LMASGSIGPSGLTLELHASPLRQPSPSRSISTKPTSMMMARGSPGKRLLANELGVGCALASRLRIEGDEPVETVEEIRQVHRGAPKQRQFVRVSLVGVTTSSDRSRRIAVRATSSTHDESFEHITASPSRCCSNCQDERRERMEQRLEESYPWISRLWRSRSKPLAHEVELTPQGSIAAGTGTPG